jgi:hypothetical protein
MPLWHEYVIALSSSESGREETATAARNLFTNTLAEIVEDAREMPPTGSAIATVVPFTEM